MPRGGAQLSYNLELAWTNISYNDLLEEYIMVSHEGYDIGKSYTYICKQGDSKDFDISLIIKKGTVMSNHIFKPMVRYADIIDETYEPYKENVDERIIENTSDIEVNKSDIASNKSDIAINRTTLGTQCKNLLKNTAVTKTVNGVTFTVNDDSTITANGTATSRIIFLVGTVYISQTGNYTYTGTPSGGASATYSMNYRNSNVYKDVDTGNGTTAQFEGGKTYEAVIDIRSGVTISNLTFKPMLRYADITDSTYEPYKENLIELYNSLLGSFVDVDLSKITFDTGISLTSNPANRLRYKKNG